MKRALILLPLALVFGCGPSTPAETPAASATATAEPAPTASADAKPADTAAASASAAPTAAPAAPPPPAAPNVTATLGGKEFKPKVAITMGPLYKGRVLVAIADYDTACDKAVEMAEGFRTLALQIEWKAGGVAFTGDKKIKGGPADPWFTVVGADKKLKQTPFVSKGKVELAAAPKEVGKSTRMTLDLTSGKDVVKGDIELHVCWEIRDEPTPPAK